MSKEGGLPVSIEEMGYLKAKTDEHTIGLLRETQVIESQRFDSEEDIFLVLQSMALRAIFFEDLISRGITLPKATLDILARAQQILSGIGGRD